MSKPYTPNLPYNIPAKILRRSDKPKKTNGVNQYEYTEDDKILFCSAKSYGGTEKGVNGVSVIVDTWFVEMWFTPNVRKGDKIRFLDDGSEYEILATPENINRENIHMKFKVERIGG